MLKSFVCLAVKAFSEKSGVKNSGQFFTHYLFGGGKNKTLSEDLILISSDIVLDSLEREWTGVADTKRVVHLEDGMYRDLYYSVGGWDFECSLLGEDVEVHNYDFYDFHRGPLKWDFCSPIGIPNWAVCAIAKVLPSFRYDSGLVSFVESDLIGVGESFSTTWEFTIPSDLIIEGGIVKLNIPTCGYMKATDVHF